MRGRAARGLGRAPKLDPFGRCLDAVDSVKALARWLCIVAALVASACGAPSRELGSAGAARPAPRAPVRLEPQPASRASEAGPRRLNVILILIDSLRADMPWAG